MGDEDVIEGPLKNVKRSGGKDCSGEEEREGTRTIEAFK